MQINRPKAAITSVAGYVPPDLLTNADLEKMVDTTDEWIRTRTGVESRHILKGEGKGVSDMGAPAVELLCKKRGISPEEIDLIICATVTGDHAFPSSANIIGGKVGAVNAFSFDVAAACSGFLYAMSVGSKYIESGAHKKVVVVGTDKMSTIVDYTDRTTCVIFGDGAGAVLLEPDLNGYGLQDEILRADGIGYKYLHQKAGGSAYPASHDTVEKKEHFIFQEGNIVFKHAVKNMADVSYEIMERNKLSGEDIAYLVPHQANKRIIDATANRMGLDPKKVMLNIQRYGNTTAATIPLCLWDWEKKLKKGDNLIMASFGGGFTWGAMYLKWAYDTPQA